MGPVDDSLASTECNKASFESLTWPVTYFPPPPSTSRPRPIQVDMFSTYYLFKLYSCIQIAISERLPCTIDPIARLIATRCCQCSLSPGPSLSDTLKEMKDKYGKHLLLSQYLCLDPFLFFDPIWLLAIKISYPSPASGRRRYINIK